MSLARAIETGDPAALPSRRDEDWRWTDLRGLLRTLPPPAPVRLDRVVVPAGETRDLTLTFAAAPGEARRFRVHVEIGEGAELRLVERLEGQGDAISDIELTMTVGRGGRLNRLVVADDEAQAVTVSRAEIDLAPGARFAQTVITAGARRQRLETRLRHPGGGASARMDGLYLLRDRRHADITTVVAHEGRDGETEQLIKGVVDDQARGVFQGRIVVARGADGTAARMAHHALVLSDRAEVDAKPELEIYADDVVCNHGNSIGALDEDALFYARQRGLGEADARALLTRAFVAEVVDRIGDDGARDAARAWVAGQFERRS